MMIEQRCCDECGWEEFHLSTNSKGWIRIKCARCENIVAYARDGSLIQGLNAVGSSKQDQLAQANAE